MTDWYKEFAELERRLAKLGANENYDPDYALEVQTEISEAIVIMQMRPHEYDDVLPEIEQGLADWDGHERQWQSLSKRYGALIPEHIGDYFERL